MQAKLPLFRILIASIIGTLILGGLFIGLLYYRMSQLSTADYTSCQGLTEPMISNCFSQITYAFITNGQWTSIIAVILILIATILGFITGKNSQALVVSPLTGLISSVLLLNAIEPGGRLIALVCFLGFCLGGLISHRQHLAHSKSQ